MYSQATVSAVLVVKGRLVNSVFWDSSRTCHLGLVPVETWLQLESVGPSAGPRTVLSASSASGAPPGGKVIPEPLWMGQTY